MRRHRQTFPDCRHTALATNVYVLNAKIEITDVDPTGRPIRRVERPCPRCMKTTVAKLDKCLGRDKQGAKS